MNQELIKKINEQEEDPYYADNIAKIMVWKGLIFEEEEKEIATMIRGYA